MTGTHTCRNRSCSLHDFVIDPHGIKNCIECGTKLDAAADWSSLLGDITNPFGFGGFPGFRK